MARGMQNPGGKAADPEGFTVGEQAIELASIGDEVGFRIEQFCEKSLNHRHPIANAGLAPQRGAQIGGGGQVVGMDMGFQHPFDRQPALADMGDDPVRRMARGTARGGVVIKNGIDDGAPPGRGILGDMGGGKGCLVEKGGDHEHGMPPRDQPWRGAADRAFMGGSCAPLYIKNLI